MALAGVVSCVRQRRSEPSQGVPVFVRVEHERELRAACNDSGESQRGVCPRLFFFTSPSPVRTAGGPGTDACLHSATA